MDRVVDLASDGLHVSLLRGFLLVTADGREAGRVPLDDIASVIVHGHGSSFSANLLAALAERGVPLVICGANHLPVSVALPVDRHTRVGERIRAQLACPRPLAKQLWKRVVVAKIAWQAAVLDAFGVDPTPVATLTRKVGSGDPANVEAQAARRYFPLLMGRSFRRDRDEPGLNGLLNYGYTVMRAMCARAIAATGLTPSVGIHHGHRGNAFALADDVVEPFRPLVDGLALGLFRAGHPMLTAEAKLAFARLAAADLDSGQGTTTVGTAALDLARSLADAFETRRADALRLPAPLPPLALRALFAPP